MSGLLSEHESRLLTQLLGRRVLRIRLIEYCFSFRPGSYISETVCLQFGDSESKQILECFPFRTSSGELGLDFRIGVRAVNAFRNESSESDSAASDDIGDRLALRTAPLLITSVQVFERADGEPNLSYTATQGIRVHPVTGDQILSFCSGDGRRFCIGADHAGNEEGLGGEVSSWVGSLSSTNAADFRERLVLSRSSACAK